MNKLVLKYILLFFWVSFAGSNVLADIYDSSYAIIISISKYSSLRFPDLPDSNQDALAIANLLRNKGFKTTILLDRRATRHAIIAKIKNKIAPKLKKNDRVLFYFSGHTYIEKVHDRQMDYIVAYDKVGFDESFKKTLISSHELKSLSMLMNNAKHQLFIINNKFCGFTKTKKSIIDTKSIEIISNNPARQIISSGPCSQQIESTSLSKYFLEALQTDKTDSNRDGYITFSELNSFMMTKEGFLAGIFPGHNNGDFLFTSNFSKSVPEDLSQTTVVVKSQKPEIKKEIIKEKGFLTIKTRPQDAFVKILNKKINYEPEIELGPGNYKIEISKQGYQTKTRWIKIRPGKKIEKLIILQEEPVKSKLFVETDPEEARIRILNINPLYQDGMELKSGNYHIEVSKAGYKKVSKWYTLKHGQDEKIHISLERLDKKEEIIKEKTEEKTFIKNKLKENVSINNFLAAVQKESLKKKLTLTPSMKKDLTQKANKFLEDAKTLKQKNMQQKKLKPQKQDIELTKKQEMEITAYEKAMEEKFQKENLINPDIQITEKYWKEPFTGMEFVWVEGGCFVMGCGSWTNNCSDDEKPIHKVCLSSFWMGKYEVTQDQWMKVMENNPSLSTYGGSYPVETVSWDEANEFIRKLNNKTGRNYSLPTEAQWEYTCRSCGQSHKYSGGGIDLNYVAWYNQNSLFSTHNIGVKSPNKLNIFDLNGNVSEWCADSYSTKAYVRHRINDPVVKGRGKLKVYRGGDWSDDMTSLRCSSRKSLDKNLKSKDLGFRLVLNKPEN